ncbi:hypothetical protein K504DRAFT_537172 [Pleomassaria siparia CBS 279.74]|uniref:Uncharacterized protein n=1 Tax=Pleomassaria siparia CBS 279.74 TaxID=1314801 RepID=A0A6G1JZC1_9PLEO|nr:hypothetical protein K504DRAFT_537172 [Pleomassaria siparia CBS 279.74]
MRPPPFTMTVGEDSPADLATNGYFIDHMCILVSNLTVTKNGTARYWACDTCSPSISQTSIAAYIWCMRMVDGAERIFKQERSCIGNSSRKYVPGPGNAVLAHAWSFDGSTSEEEQTALRAILPGLIGIGFEDLIVIADPDEKWFKYSNSLLGGIGYRSG